MTARRLLAATALLVSSAAAMALCPSPKPTACSQFAASDAVYVGTVLDVQYGDWDTDDPWVEFTVRVGKTFKGKTASIERVRTENNSGRWVGDLGETYVLFVAKQRVLGTCTDLDDPAKAAKTIQAIGACNLPAAGRAP